MITLRTKIILAAIAYIGLITASITASILTDKSQTIASVNNNDGAIISILGSIVLGFVAGAVIVKILVKYCK
jgi:predicted DNA repair protein MutK